MITFESILEADSPVLTALRDPVSRPTILAALRPTTLAASTVFPSSTLSPQSTALAFPPLGKPIGGSGDIKGKSAEATKTSTARLGRMNPFASFFGSATPPTATPTIVSTSEEMVSRFDLSPNSGSPNPSIRSAEVPDSLSDAVTKDAEGFSVQAYTISKAIRTAEVHKSLTKAIRSDIKDDLSRLPEKVIERVMKLVLASICPTSGSAQDIIKSQLTTEPDSIPSIDFGQPAQASEQLQDFIEAVYDDLLVYFRSDSSLFVAEAGLKRKGSGGKPWSRPSLTGNHTPEEDMTKETKDQRRREREVRAEKMGTEGTERVEGLITRLLYNR